MKVLILNIIIWITSLAFSQQDNVYSPNKKPWKSSLNQMKFREPILFTPFEAKIGYLNYGGKNYWSSLPFNSNEIDSNNEPILLDSTQYNFNIINSLKNRSGYFIELDIIRTNLPQYTIYQNYLDFQLGIGFQYTNLSSKLDLPAKSGNVWNNSSDRGNYLFSPKSMGINLNSSLSWQIKANRASYLYYSFGLNSISLYESEGGSKSLTGTGFTESFGIGTKYIINQTQNDFSYTFGIEIKWNRLYINQVKVPNDLSPIHGIDLYSSGIFFTTGIQFGGKQTDADIAYNEMINEDYISAVENFEFFLAKEREHGKRKAALEMLQYCKSQIPYQHVNLGIQKISETNFDEAVNLFTFAEEDANDTLITKIKLHRKNIANSLIDSVNNYKNKMSIQDAENLILAAIKLEPNNKQTNMILAGLYFDKGVLNSSIGNYSEAIQNYMDAIKLHPPIKELIYQNFDKMINAIIKDAFFSIQREEIYQVIKSIETIIILKPELALEWEHYLIILKEKVNNINNNKYAQKYILNKQKESIPKKDNVIELGMTYKEVEKIKGTPEIIDEINETNQYFQMWTYNTNSKRIHLYFQNHMLIRIDQ